jgi:hypothetical protein
MAGFKPQRKMLGRRYRVLILCCLLLGFTYLASAPIVENRWDMKAISRWTSSVTVVPRSNVSRVFPIPASEVAAHFPPYYAYWRFCKWDADPDLPGFKDMKRARSRLARRMP